MNHQNDKVMNTKKEYIAPQLTAVSFKPEKGYALSWLHMFQMQDDLDYDNSNQEYWLWNSENPGQNRFGGDWDWD